MKNNKEIMTFDDPRIGWHLDEICGCMASLSLGEIGYLFPQEYMINLHDTPLADFEFHKVSLDFGHKRIIALYGILAGEKVETHKYPADWIEAFKEKWASKAYLKRYPVKYTYVVTMMVHPSLRPWKKENK